MKRTLQMTTAATLLTLVKGQANVTNSTNTDLPTHSEGENITVIAMLGTILFVVVCLGLATCFSRSQLCQSFLRVRRRSNGQSYRFREEANSSVAGSGDRELQIPTVRKSNTIKKETNQERWDKMMKRVDAFKELAKAINNDTQISKSELADIETALKSFEIPECYIDIYTLNIMEEPFITDDGFSYEKNQLDKAREYDGNAPFDTSKKVTTILPNRSLKIALNHFLSQKEVELNRIDTKLKTFSDSALGEKHTLFSNQGKSEENKVVEGSSFLTTKVTNRR